MKLTLDRDLFVLPGLFVIVSMSLSGCVAFSSDYEGNPIEREMIDQIQVRQTTRAEVLELLGEPLSIDQVDITGLTERLLSRFEGEVPLLQLDPALFDELYVYQRTQTDRFALFLLFYNRIETEQRSDRLTILFDPDGIVLGVGWTPGTDEL